MRVVKHILLVANILARRVCQFCRLVYNASVFIAIVCRQNLYIHSPSCWDHLRDDLALPEFRTRCIRCAYECPCVVCMLFKVPCLPSRKPYAAPLVPASNPCKATHTHTHIHTHTYTHMLRKTCHPCVSTVMCCSSIVRKPVRCLANVITSRCITARILHYSLCLNKQGIKSARIWCS